MFPSEYQMPSTALFSAGCSQISHLPLDTGLPISKYLLQSLTQLSRRSIDFQALHTHSTHFRLHNSRQMSTHIKTEVVVFCRMQRTYSKRAGHTCTDGNLNDVALFFWASTFLLQFAAFESMRYSYTSFLQPVIFGSSLRGWEACTFTEFGFCILRSKLFFSHSRRWCLAKGHIWKSGDCMWEYSKWHSMALRL